MTKNYQKLPKIQFNKKIDYLSFFYPFLKKIYIFAKYLIFQRFWYQNFENWVKTQLPAFLKISET